jgi:hypothetical protein
LSKKEHLNEHFSTLCFFINQLELGPYYNALTEAVSHEYRFDFSSMKCFMKTEIRGLSDTAKKDFCSANGKGKTFVPFT